jgi:transposase
MPFNQMGKVVMRGADITQVYLFSCRTLEERIPTQHPLRKLRVIVDGILGSMDAELEGWYSCTCRVSIPPQRLLMVSLIQTLFSIRSE